MNLAYGPRLSRYPPARGRIHKHLASGMREAGDVLASINVDHSENPRCELLIRRSYGQSAMLAAAACSSCLGLAPAPVIESGGLSLRMLALELLPGHERYVTQVRGAGEAEWSAAAVLSHMGGTEWLVDDSRVTLGTPDDVYADVMALCSPEVPSDRHGLGAELVSSLGAEVPHWPPELVSSLERRRLHGSGTVAFCPEHFLSVIASSPMDSAVLLPHAESRLGVAGLKRAGRICRRAAEAFKRCEAEAATTIVAKTTFDEYGRRRTSTPASANAAFLGKNSAVVEPRSGILA